MRDARPADEQQQIEHDCQNQSRAKVRLQQEKPENRAGDNQMRQNTNGEGFDFSCLRAIEWAR